MVRLFVHRHLDGDVRKVVVDGFVRERGDGGVVFRVLVVLDDRADSEGDVLDELHAEEEGDGEEQGEDRDECESDEIIVKRPLLNEDIDTLAHEIYNPTM